MSNIKKKMKERENNGIGQFGALNINIEYKELQSSKILVNYGIESYFKDMNRYSYAAWLGRKCPVTNMFSTACGTELK